MVHMLPPPPGGTQEKANREAEEKKLAAQSKGGDVDSAVAGARSQRRDGFPDVAEGERLYQKNEGK